MRAVVLSIGSELVTGLRLDTHAADIARALSAIGIDLVRHVTLDDDEQSIAVAFQQAGADADLVVATGGLGPTQDDCTRNALAQAMGVALEVHPQAAAHLEEWARAHGRKISPSNRVQILLPRGAAVLANPVGTAVGIEAQVGGARVFCMPGVPTEMRQMLRDEILPRLQKADPDRLRRVRTIRTFGMPESSVGERLGELMSPGRHPHVGTAVHAGVIDVHIYAVGSPDEVERLLEADARLVRERLGEAVFGEGEDGMEHAVAALLDKAGATLALAESCTGGLIAAALVSVPGMSDHLLEGVVAYSNESKVRRLGVDAKLIGDHGAVSEPVVRAMAEGIRAATAADFGLAVTGIAGPGGGTDEKPVGTVWLAVDGRKGTQAVRQVFTGDRALIRRRATYYALNMLRLHLLDVLGRKTGER